MPLKDDQTDLDLKTGAVQTEDTEGTGPTAESTGTADEAAAETGETTQGEPPAEKPDPARLLQLAQAAERQSVTFAQQNWRPVWERSYKSFRSEYIDNSKYKSADYRHRSKIFRPKTRISVTKDMAGAAQTLFSTVDAVSITAGDDSDPMQVANAELNAALVNYRLDRTSGKNAVPWFLLAMGARQDCQIAGVCCSKQYWSYQVGKNGKLKKDKPEIDLLAPENIGMDNAAVWTDPINSGAYFFARYPMHVQDVKDRMKDPRIKWKPVATKEDGKDDNSVWTAAKVREFDMSQVRRAREGGQDRMDNSTSTDRELDVVWVYEWFLRTADDDWNFWTLGKDHMLSDPVPTEEAYPWRGGERPYRLGYGNLEAHRIVPQSPVETLQPLQQEINDITNLRLDNLKQVIQPVALVKRGKKIDTDALKRRYPVVYLDDKDDVSWDRPPDSAASSFAETSRLDTDFDDLAGTFNGGSVANNRQVGETVGGMKLMAGAANAVSEFYVRLWVETWVEPVLSDLSKLESYYESDDKILALARKRAPSMQHWGENPLTDELLSQEVIVRVSAGVGSPDPMQKLSKLGQAMAMTKDVVGASKKFATGQIQINEEAIINEIFGNAGMKDGFDRFFTEAAPPPVPGAPPAPGTSPAELADKAADRTSKEKIATLNAKTKITEKLIQHRAGQKDQQREHSHKNKHAFMDTMIRALEGHHTAKNTAADREIAARQPTPPLQAAPF